MPAQDHMRLTLTKKNWHSVRNGQILICCQAQALRKLQELSNDFKDWNILAPAEFSSALKRLNGFFAIIMHSDERTAIAVDKVRSIPLFYSIDKKEFLIADNANLLQDTSTTGKTRTLKGVDPVSAAEFAAGLYLNGSRTLDRNIRQVQAGEWVELCSSPTAKSVKAHDYFRLSYQFDGKYNGTCFNDSLSEVTNKSIDNFLSIADNRQIVLPLSGGYDSRLLAIKLVERGANNLMAYSYGVNEHCPEVVTAQQVAKTLSIDWIFIPDTQQDWEEAWPTKTRQKFGLNAANLCSFPLVQDWLVVKKLEQTGKLQTSAIFCPGHTGDFVSGGKIPQSIISHTGKLTFNSQFSDDADQALDQLAQLIADREFAHSNINKYRFDIETRIREHLGSPVENTQKVDAEFLVQRLYDWAWRHRQSKYIVNSVRVYEDHGYDWWLPFWDSTFLEFWAHVPLSQLVGQTHYIEYVKTAYAEIAETNYDKSANEPNEALTENAARNLWVRSPLLQKVRAFLPYRVQETASKLKRRIKGARYSNSIMPVPSQPFTQIRSQPTTTSKVRVHSTKYVLPSCPPVDALGLLAQEFVEELLDNDVTCEPTEACTE